MTKTKDMSQEQKFFEFLFFSHENGPKSEFQTNCYKNLAHDSFQGNYAFLSISCHFNAKFDFLDNTFSLI